MNRRLGLGVVALSMAAMAIAPAGWSAAGQDEARRLVEALAMDVPARPMLAPPFVLRGLDGADTRLPDLQGRMVLLYFWTTW